MPTSTEKYKQIPKNIRKQAKDLDFLIIIHTLNDSELPRKPPRKRDTYIHSTCINAPTAFAHMMLINLYKSDCVM